MGIKAKPQKADRDHDYLLKVLSQQNAIALTAPNLAATGMQHSGNITTPADSRISTPYWAG